MMGNAWQEMRERRRLRLEALADAGFTGAHAAGGGFVGVEFTVCTRCGALVSLESRDDPDVGEYAWAVAQHIDWHDQQPPKPATEPHDAPT